MISMPELRSRPSPAGRPALALDTAVLCLLVIIAPQLFGGAFPWTVVAIAGLALLALGTAVWVRRESPRPIADPLFVTMGIAWLWTCVQAVPLPSSLADALQLGSMENVERLRGLDWAGTIPITISFDPGATQVQVLIGIAILATFLAARLGGRSGLRPIAMATILSAVLIGLEGIAHRIGHAEAVFGQYAPRFTEPQLLTPLMNNNHLGGFMLLGALLAAGLAAQPGAGSRRLWAPASAFCAIIVAWTLSRGAIGALLFGFVLLAAWLAGTRRSDRRGLAVPLAVVGAAAIGTLAFAGLEPILRRFEAQGLDKLAVAARGFRLLEGSTWWLGIGRGAFSSTFVAEEGSLARYTHPENILVQWSTEWGVLLAGALFLAVFTALWTRLRAAERPMTAATCIAIFALSLQNLVDFSLEMAGIVVVVAALLGALLPAPTVPASKRSGRLLAGVLAIFVVALASLGPRVLESDTGSIVDRLTFAMEADREAEFEKVLREGLALHPGEPAFALLAGTYAGAKRYPDAPRWLLTVMDEAPGWAAPHTVAAHWLLEDGQVDQALLEIREAEERHPGSARREVCEILARFPEMDRLERAAPSVELRVPYLDRASACPGLPAELRAEIDAAILQSEPTRATAVLRHARRLVSRDQAGEAKALLETALAHDPDEISLWVALARAELDAGHPEEARARLAAARARGLEHRTLIETQARVEAAVGQVDAMRTTLTRLRGRARGEASSIARSFLLEAELEASLGHVDEALAAYTAADAADPTTPALQYAAAYALKSGRTNQARQLYRTLCVRDPTGPACTQEARLAK